MMMLAQSMARATMDAIDRLIVTPDPITFRTDVERALQGIGRSVGLNSTVLATLDPETRVIERIFVGQDNGMSDLIPLFIADEERQDTQLSRIVLWRTRGGEVVADEGIQDPLTDAPAAFAVVIRHHRRPKIMMLGEFGDNCQSLREDMPTLVMVAELLLLAIERHQQASEIDALQRQLNEARSREATGQFAGTVAHELNNNMTAIMGYAEMAMESVSNDDAVHDYLEEVLSAGRRSQAIIEKVLVARRLPRDMAMSFNIADAIMDALPLLCLGFEKPVTLNVALPRSPLLIAGSSLDFQQILFQLSKLIGTVQTVDGPLSLIVEATDQSATETFSHGRIFPGQFVQIVLSSGISCESHPVLADAIDPLEAGALARVHEAVATLLDGVMHAHCIAERVVRVELFLPRQIEYREADQAQFCSHHHQIGSGERVAVIDIDSTALAAMEDRLALSGYEPLGFRSRSAFADWCLRATLPVDIVIERQADNAAQIDRSERQSRPPDKIHWVNVAVT